jgi:orotate phosphoribosyltransferase-like protein
MSEAKIDQRMIDRVRELRMEGKTQGEISAEVGLSQGSVSLILRAHGLGGYLVKKKSSWRELLQTLPRKV